MARYNRPDYQLGLSFWSLGICLGLLQHGAWKYHQRMVPATPGLNRALCTRNRVMGILLSFMYH